MHQLQTVQCPRRSPCFPRLHRWLAAFPRQTQPLQPRLVCAYVMSALVGRARGCLMLGPIVSTACTSAAWPTWPPMCTPCAAHPVGSIGRHRQQNHCRVHGIAMRNTTLRRPANSGSTPTYSCVALLLPAHFPCRLGTGRVRRGVAGTARRPYALGAPVHRRADNVRMPEWICLRCNTTVDGSHHLLQNIPDRPVCPTHGPRLLGLDLREGSRGWVCARGSPPQILQCTCMNP